MSAPLLRFELAEEAARLRAESEFLEGDRNARTLTKARSFRVVLVAFRAGAMFDENDQRGSVALHLLDGRLSMRVGGAGIELGPGELAVVSAEQPWVARAMTDGLVLLHVAWPPEAASV
ncbi:MAG TPA: hypothetical protein VFP56_04405 [Candidatus Limnocylindrales bacterium]|nr:hypothetical protein [Candidatus Limnocylindrales bacterium]